MRYNPDITPKASKWLALDEDERIAAIERSHDAAVPNLHLHAAIHAAVETQLALKLPSVVAAAARLHAEGLDRHDTIHAIGSVLAGHMWELMRAETTEGDPNVAYFAALDGLSAESWHRDYGSPEGG